MTLNHNISSLSCQNYQELLIVHSIPFSAWEMLEILTENSFLIMLCMKPSRDLSVLIWMRCHFVSENSKLINQSDCTCVVRIDFFPVLLSDISSEGRIHLQVNPVYSTNLFVNVFLSDNVSWSDICCTFNAYRWLSSPCERMWNVHSKDLCL